MRTEVVSLSASFCIVPHRLFLLPVSQSLNVFNLINRRFVIQCPQPGLDFIDRPYSLEIDIRQAHLGLSLLSIYQTKVTEQIQVADREK